MAGHKRKSIRLAEYDYAQPGAYFVTISTQQKATVFGHLNGETVELNRLGVIAQANWAAIPQHFTSVRLDTYVVMPNHLHGILFIHESQLDKEVSQTDARAQHAAPLQRLRVAPGSLGAIVRSYKASVTRAIRQLRGYAAPIWQRNYFERVVRNQQELDALREYVQYNPLKPLTTGLDT